MTKQKTDYQHQSAADRRRDQADTTIDRLKGSGERAQEMAFDVAEQLVNAARRRNLRHGNSSPSSKNHSRSNP
jgi:hypothetical protein